MTPPNKALQLTTPRGDRLAARHAWRDHSCWPPASRHHRLGRQGAALQLSARSVSRTRRRRAMPSDYERVYAITFYHDGIWHGAADFDGRPHAYEIVGDHDATSPMYRLSPLSPEALSVAKELWGTGFNWNRSGRPDQDRSPRIDELYEQLDSLLFIDDSSCVRARGEFRRTASAPLSLQFPEMEVRWQRSEDESGRSVLEDGDGPGRYGP